MISEKIGTLLKKSTKNKTWWLKLGGALMLSNIFFFLLFGGSSEVKSEVTDASGVPTGWVEAQIMADLLTPFQKGKKVLLIQRIQGKKIEALLKESGNNEGKIVVLVKEEEAHGLFLSEGWEVLPYLKQLSFNRTKKDYSHEIHY